MSNSFRDDMDEYHAFMSTCSDDNNLSTGGGGSDSSAGRLPWLFAIVGILWIIGKIF